MKQFEGLFGRLTNILKEITKTLSKLGEGASYAIQH